MFRFRCEKCPSYGVLRRSHLERHMRHHRVLESNKWGSMKIDRHGELFFCSFCNYKTYKIFNLVKHVHNCKAFKAGKKPVLKVKMPATNFEPKVEALPVKESKAAPANEVKKTTVHKGRMTKRKTATVNKQKAVGVSLSKKLLARSRRMITQKALTIREEKSQSADLNQLQKNSSGATVTSANIEKLIEKFTVHGSEKRHRCKICGYESNNVGHVVRHMVVHRKDAKKWPYKCSKCSARFSIKGNLAIHLKVHSSEGNYFSCTACDKVYQSRVGLYKHNRKFHSQSEDPDVTERKKSSTKQKSPQAKPRKYKKRVTEELLIKDETDIDETFEQEVPLSLQTHKCPQCDYVAQTRILLKIHIRDFHSPQKSLPCTLCSYVTTEENELINHMKIIHSSGDSFHCSLCPFSATSKGELDKHLNQHSVGSVYMCEECHYITDSSEELQGHACVHVKGKPYNCPGCPFSTSWKRDFDVHLEAHGASEAYRCHYCDFAVSTARSLDIHLRLHVRMEPFRCSLCQYTTNNRATFEWHMRCHTDESLFKCNFCESHFQKKVSLLLHMRMHSEHKSRENGDALNNNNNNVPQKTPLQPETDSEMKSCDHCDFQTVQPLMLAQHLRNEHSEAMPFKCGLCGFSASKLNNYYQHMRRFHVDHGIQYKCPYCDFAGIQKSDLVVHMRTHSGQRPFKCEYCSYETTRKSLLTQHMRQHTGEKPYKCESCNFTTATYNNLARHKRCHTGEKPYHCEQCDFTTGQRSHLARHVRIHTGEKPYMCSWCGLSSAYSTEIKRHQQMHNKAKPFKCPHCCYSTNKNYAHTRHINRYHKDMESESKTRSASELKPREDSPLPLEHFLPSCESPCSNTDTQPPVLELQHPTLDFTSLVDTNGYIHPQHVCQYCDRRFDSQEEWDKHVKRHFMEWPEPANPGELIASVRASSQSGNSELIHAQMNGNA
ncbi:zinc finger protein 271-like [Ptychodera flava]|uniref:zinc finger protein 271-like n=1 Tax=Ptychodera flava TaxID=63121 RepID=UPI00396A0B8C